MVSINVGVMSVSSRGVRRDELGELRCRNPARALPKGNARQPAVDDPLAGRGVAHAEGIGRIADREQLWCVCHKICRHV